MIPSQSGIRKRTIFGEAFAFYQVQNENGKGETQTNTFVTYREIQGVEKVLNVSLCGKWPNSDKEPLVIDVEWIVDIVGIWEPPSSEKVYILRKHPGFTSLTPEEMGCVTSIDDTV